MHGARLIATICLVISAVPPAMAITIDQMEATLKSRICPANPQLVSTMSYQQACGGKGYETRLPIQQVLQCQSMTNAANDAITKYNSFVSKCRSGSNTLPTPAPKPAPLPTKPARSGPEARLDEIIVAAKRKASSVVPSAELSTMRRNAKKQAEIHSGALDEVRKALDAERQADLARLKELEEGTVEDDTPPQGNISVNHGNYADAPNGNTDPFAGNFDVSQCAYLEVDRSGSVDQQFCAIEGYTVRLLSGIDPRNFKRPERFEGCESGVLKIGGITTYICRAR